MSFRSLHRDDTEEMWRFQLCMLFEQSPSSSLHVFHLMYKLIKVTIFFSHLICSIYYVRIRVIENENSTSYVLVYKINFIFLNRRSKKYLVLLIKFEF